MTELELGMTTSYGWASPQLRGKVSIVQVNLMDQNAYSHHCSPYTSYGSTWENFSNISLVINFFILTTYMIDQVAVL